MSGNGYLVVRTVRCKMEEVEDLDIQKNPLCGEACLAQLTIVLLTIIQIHAGD